MSSTDPYPNSKDRDFAVYDRDRNIDGSIQSASFVPEYGSKLSFQYVSPYLNTSDYHYKSIPKNLNNTAVQYDLKFTNKTETEARSFLHLFEEVNSTQSGLLDFNRNQLTSESPAFANDVDIAFPTGPIYKNMSGLLIQDYNFNYHDSLFDVNLKLLKDNHSYFFDWSGSSYLNTDNVLDEWSPNQDYEKFDIVYYPHWQTGSGNGNFHTHVNRIEKFYYCNADHTASTKQNNAPTGLDGDMWSQDFFFDIDDGIKILTDRKNEITKLKSSFSMHSKKNANMGLIQNLTIQLKNRSDKETFAILHFAEKHENMRPFQFSLPQLYTKKKFFVINNLTHTFVYKDCNTISMTISEIIKFSNNYNFTTFSHVN